MTADKRVMKSVAVFPPAVCTKSKMLLQQVTAYWQLTGKYCSFLFIINMTSGLIHD